MQKIMFNDRFNHTNLVLEEYKTQTRMIILKGIIDETFERVYNIAKETEDVPTLMNLMNYLTSDSKYKIGEEIAIAQSYKTIENDMEWSLDKIAFCGKYCETAGWINKRYVKAEIMPHKIRITNIGVERLRDIHDMDCLKEGIGDIRVGSNPTQYYYAADGKNRLFDTPREAYASLIDNIRIKGTWTSNPYVYVYDFKLIS